MGTYGSKWQTDHWPGWPADFKSEYFNAAAPDQWLDDFFQDDEPLLLQNLHPEYERIESSLPGYRTRCFMTKNQKSGHITEEARVRLDTLWLFPDVMTGALFWRADVPVTDEEASDVVEILAVPEPISAPLRTAEEYRTMPAGSDEETPKTEPPAHDSGDEPAAPETELKPPPPDLDAQAGLIAEMEAAVRETEQSYVDSLAAVGLDVNQIPPAKGLSLEQVKPFVQPLVFDPDMVQRELQEAESALDRMVQSLDLEQVQPPPPSEAFNRIMQQSSEETAEFLAQVASEEMDPEAYLALARETRLESEKIERLLADEENREKDIPPPGPEVEEQSEDIVELREPWTRDRLLHAHARGESLTGIDIGGLDLTGADLSGADMTGAAAAETNFAQADLTGVKLTEAVLTGANLTECRLINADLSRAALDRVNGPGADFTKAVLTDADLSQADLSQARFHEADLTAALFHQTRLDQAEFHGAVLAWADFSETSLTKALFHQVKGSGVVFDRASMTEAEFHQSQLNDPSFDQTRAERLTVSESRLIGLRGGAETSFQNGCFQDVDLSGAVWDGADLKGSDFRGAELDRADFSGCRLQKCDFYRARAREAKFTAADLTEASMISINLFRGNLSKADLTRTSLKGANLYEVEFYRAKMTETNLTEANLARTKLEGWHP